MLHTILGDLYIIVNGKERNYETLELANKGEIFKVDKRYKIELDNLPTVNKETVIECIINSKEGYVLDGGVETGESLALISFDVDNIKLSIGVEGDMEGVSYIYSNDRLTVKISQNANIKSLVFCIAWISMQDKEKEDIYTWFAADPTLL